MKEGLENRSRLQLAVDCWHNWKDEYDNYTNFEKELSKIIMSDLKKIIIEEFSK